SLMTALQVSARYALSEPFSLNVDFEARAGGIMAVFGPSGAGKTTLLNVIAGFARDADATVRWQGQLWQSADHCIPVERRALGFVFQNPALLPHLTVAGNLTFAAKRASTPIAIETLVEQFDLGALQDQPVAALSGGESRRVAIARALVQRPEVLLLDEPLTGLDELRRQEVLPYLERLKENTRLVLLVSHRIDDVARLADEVLVMNDGQVQQQGPIVELLPSLTTDALLDNALGVVLPARVASYDDAWQLTTLATDAGDFQLAGRQGDPGDQRRVRILARDVSIALQAHEDTSIVNRLPATVSSIDEFRAGQCRVTLDANGVVILALLTRHSVARLQLSVGRAVHVQVKSVALLS
ncbi:MAG: molybdenum ABC transporter ATP-binding protein, partial [Pseudomonadota bacterium]